MGGREKDEDKSTDSHSAAPERQVGQWDWGLLSGLLWTELVLGSSSRNFQVGRRDGGGGVLGKGVGHSRGVKLPIHSM